MFQNTLIDNSKNLLFAQKLKSLIDCAQFSEIKIATGYWDLPGTKIVLSELKSFFERGGVLKLLIGQEPLLRSYQKNLAASENETFPDFYIQRDIESLSCDYKDVAALLQKYMDERDSDGAQMQVRVYGQAGQKKFLHAKCYIFNGNSTDGKIACGIIGSSNFTKNGLTENAELNYLEADKRIVNFNDAEDPFAKGHNSWFDEKWSQSVPWSGKFLREALNKKFPPAPSATPKAEQMLDPKILLPYEAYIKVLIDQFESYINSAPAFEKDFFPRDKNFKALSYQAEAVNQAYTIMKKYGGFILADVVGLGKTFVAIMIAKRFLMEENFLRSVLVLAPPAVKKSWQDSVEYFDKDAPKKIAPFFEISTIGTFDFEEEVYGESFDKDFPQKNFGLVIVDESHNFRNRDTIMYKKLSDIILQNKAYVALLSATPQNNRPNDLASQIYLFVRERKNSPLKGLGEFDNNLESFFAQKEREYEECIRDYKSKDAQGRKIKKSEAEKKADIERLAQISEELRSRVVAPLVIRRTRTDIKKYYADDMKTQGLFFPEIMPPVAIPYKMTSDMASLFFSSLEIIAPTISNFEVDENPTLDFADDKNCIGYFRYRAIEFLKSREHQKIYEARRAKNSKEGVATVTGISERLAAMMELHLVKRLESSRDAFEKSLENFRANTCNMLEMLEANRVFICPDLNVNEILCEENREKKGGFDFCLSELAQKAKRINEKKGVLRNCEFFASDFSSDYKEKLQNDLRLANYLIEKWKGVKDDPKMATFVRNINTFMDKKKNPAQKLVIFSECIATQNAIAKKLSECASEYKVLSITSKNRIENQEIIAANFDANYSGQKKDDYRILLTTDTLSEGVNLHAANTILNYDSPWNATRLMQRLGRINRIGCQSPKIYAYNFYPSAEGNAQINLYKRTLVKLQAFHNLFGEDSQIYTTEENLVEHELLKFENEGESSDMKFISELKEFRKNNPKKFEELKNIESLVFSAVKIPKENLNKENSITENLQCEGFAIVHKIKAFAGKKTKSVSSTLYKTEGKKIVFPRSQIEFVEAIKNVSHLPLEKIDQSEAKKIALDAKDALDLEIRNSNLNIKSKFDFGKKERIGAIEKIKKMRERLFADGFKNAVATLDQIAESVRKGNAALTRKINAAQTQGVFPAELEALAAEWQKMCAAREDENAAFFAECKLVFLKKR